MPTLVTLFQVQSLLIDVQMQLLKKKIILRECPYIFSSDVSLKTTPSPLAHNTDENNQALKVLFSGSIGSLSQEVLSVAERCI